jgi:bifunctional DNA-binding transcriptional regulator/antitoxin component of YhaV-PrlF toxin-antitoxin module
MIEETMVLRETRSVGGTGSRGRSRSLTLPLPWAEGNGIDRGSSVVVVYDAETLVIVPASAGEGAVQRAVRLLGGFRRVRPSLELRVPGGTT